MSPRITQITRIQTFINGYCRTCHEFADHFGYCPGRNVPRGVIVVKPPQCWRRTRGDHGDLVPPEAGHRA